MLFIGKNMIKDFGERRLFTIEQLGIEDGDRIGLVGCNGAGKSTLLRIIYGELPLDGGIIKRNCKIAWICQDGESEVGTLADDVLLGKLGVKASPCQSGGERTRLAIANAFSQNAPLLLADEPTTNLDLEGVLQLEKMLSAYRGAIVIVSHDRSLLDSVCTKIWEVESGSLKIFPGNYSNWLVEKERQRNFALFSYEQYVDEKKRLESAVREISEEAKGMHKPPKHMGSSEWMLYKGTASIMQGHMQKRGKAIKKRLEHMEEVAKPESLPQVAMALGAGSTVVAKTAAYGEDISVAYGRKAVLRDAKFTLPVGKRTVILGANGAGKTTLANLILKGDERIKIANGIKIGYFSQNHEGLNFEKTVIENVRFESLLPEHDLRTILANLNFSREDIHKKASVLSGGERAKTAFAKLFAADINFLILDEPTNHIDVYTAEALEKLLLKWQGTMLVITHDRRLTEKIAQRILFIKDGKISSFEGSWNEYEEQEKERKPEKNKDYEEEMLLAMRIAALNGRMTHPQKGDRPENLQKEWEDLIAMRKK